MCLPQINVMMLYTETIKSILGDLSDSQMDSTLAVAIASSNQALNNSSIDAEFRLVYVGPVRSSSHLALASCAVNLYMRGKVFFNGFLLLFLLFWW